MFTWTFKIEQNEPNLNALGCRVLQLSDIPRRRQAVATNTALLLFNTSREFHKFLTATSQVEKRRARTKQKKKRLIMSSYIIYVSFQRISKNLGSVIWKVVKA